MAAMKQVYWVFPGLQRCWLYFLSYLSEIYIFLFYVWPNFPQKHCYSDFSLEGHQNLQSLLNTDGLSYEMSRVF